MIRKKAFYVCVYLKLLKLFQLCPVFVCLFTIFPHYLFMALTVLAYFFTYTQIHTLFGINNHTLCTTQNNIGQVMNLSCINYLN